MLEVFETAVADGVDESEIESGCCGRRVDKSRDEEKAMARSEYGGCSMILGNRTFDEAPRHMKGGSEGHSSRGRVKERGSPQSRDLLESLLH